MSNPVLTKSMGTRYTGAVLVGSLDICNASQGGFACLQILQENNYMHPVYAPDSEAESADEDDEWEEVEGEEAEAALAADRDWKRPAEAAGKLLGELSDHRPLNLNADDFLRCSHVPPDGKYRNFRDFPEVVNNADGGCHTLTAASIRVPLSGVEL